MAEPLRIRFASDIDAAKKGMADLSASVAANALSMGASLKAVNDNAAKLSSAMASLPSSARNLAQITAALVALKIAADVTAFAVNTVKDNLADLVKIGNDARAAGVGTNFFQAWTLQARELGTEVGKLEGMLTRGREAATVRIGEGGKAASSDILNRLDEHLKAGNVSQGDIDRYTGAKDQEQRIRVILDLIDQLRAKGAQLAAFDIGAKFFGPEFERQLRSGVDLVGQMRLALDGKKFVPFDEDAVRKAERINQQLVRIDNLMAQGLAPIQRDLVALGQQQYQSWLDIKEGIALAVVGAGKLYTLIKNTLDALDKFTGENPLGTLATKLGATAIRDRLGISAPAEPPPLDLTVKPRPRTDPDTSRSLPERAKDANEAKDAVESYITALERSTAALEAEVRTYGLSNAEKQKAIALARGEQAAKERGSALTDEERRKIEALGTAAGVAKDRMAELQAASQRTAETMRAFGQTGVDALADLIDKSRTAEEVMRDLAKQLLRWSLQAAILGTGPLAGMMGTAPSATGVGAASVGGLMGAVGQVFGGIFGGTAAGSSAATTAAAAASPAMAAGGAAAASAPAAAAVAAASTPAIAAIARQVLGGALPRAMSLTAPPTAGLPREEIISDIPLAYRTPTVAGDGAGALSAGASGFAGILARIAAPDAGGAIRRLTVGNPYAPNGWLTRDKNTGRFGDENPDFTKAVPDIGKDISKAGDTVSDALKDTGSNIGASGGDLVNSLSGLASSLTRGLGGAGNLFSGAVPAVASVPGFAEGTDFAPGGLAMIGEKGPELMQVPRGAQITPNHKLAGLFAPKVEGARQSTSNKVSAPLTINQTISGNGDATIAQIAQQATQQGVAAHQRHIEHNIVGILGRAQRRGLA